MDDAVRLVCPACDTIHKVRQLTPGKPYYCKKCQAGLTTLSPAVWECSTCGAKTDPAVQPMAHPETCAHCDGAPPMTLRFVTEEIPAAASESSVIPVKQMAAAFMDEHQQQKLAQHLGQRLMADLQKQIQPDMFAQPVLQLQDSLQACLQETMLSSVDTQALQKKLADVISTAVQTILSPRIEEALTVSFGEKASSDFAESVREQIHRDLSLTFDRELVRGIAEEIRDRLSETLSPLVNEAVRQEISNAIETQLVPAVSKELQARIVESMADELHLAVTGLVKTTLDRDLTAQLQETLDKRADSIIRSTVKQTQEPLLEELHTTRRSIPLWLAAVLALGGLVLLLLVWTSSLIERSRVDDVQAQSGAAISALQANAKTMEELRTQLQEKDTELKKLQEAASVWYARSEKMGSKLRSMGVDPDALMQPKQNP